MKKMNYNYKTIIRTEKYDYFLECSVAYDKEQDSYLVLKNDDMKSILLDLISNQFDGIEIKKEDGYLDIETINNTFDDILEFE